MAEISKEDLADTLRDIQEGLAANTRVIKKLMELIPRQKIKMHSDIHKDLTKIRRGGQACHHLIELVQK